MKFDRDNKFFLNKKTYTIMTKRDFKHPFICFEKLIIILLITCISINISAQQQIRVVIAGLTHNHIHGILNQYNKGVVE